MNSSKVIFYLNDDSDDLYFFKNTMGSLGHQVLVFHKAEIMLKWLHRHPTKPEVIFLDVHVPILNGEEILSHLKSSHAYGSVPVVIISSIYPKKLVRQLLAVGANYLMKRTATNDLKTALENVLKLVFEQQKLSA